MGVCNIQDDKPGPGTYLGLATQSQSETSFSKRGTGSFASKVDPFERWLKTSDGISVQARAASFDYFQYFGNRYIKKTTNYNR